MLTRRDIQLFSVGPVVKIAVPMIVNDACVVDTVGLAAFVE
jgi:hypothetical protein